MSRTRIQLVAAAIILFGGAFLATQPANASRPMACSALQKAYMRDVAYDVCGERGGVTTAVCDGMNVRIVGVSCY
jgi:hypothetical protein